VIVHQRTFCSAVVQAEEEGTMDVVAQVLDEPLIFSTPPPYCPRLYRVSGNKTYFEVKVYVRIGRCIEMMTSNSLAMTLLVSSSRYDQRLSDYITEFRI